MANQKEIDALIKLLDEQVETGSNHINVKCEDSTDIKEKIINITSGMDCESGDTACKIPNLDLGLDDE